MVLPLSGISPAAREPTCAHQTDMPCYVYVLRSKRTGRFYIGSAEDPQERLSEHNGGRVRCTRGWRPWEIAYCQEHPTRSEAMRRERELKAAKSRKVLLGLVGEDAERLDVR